MLLSVSRMSSHILSFTNKKVNCACSVGKIPNTMHRMLETLKTEQFIVKCKHVNLVETILMNEFQYFLQVRSRCGMNANKKILNQNHNHMFSISSDLKSFQCYRFPPIVVNRLGHCI